ncbi:MAG: hypothetical protein IPH85_13395 [Ignavibacteria bacterium]|nr:hypothetical protein [Ignavibacteria bacterium]MBK7186887.1 hypothetical protein [Ignavibacteria bacterium]MBK9183114.1 hypothetical protein [Ignavibacteria bacterium]
MFTSATQPFWDYAMRTTIILVAFVTFLTACDVKPPLNADAEPIRIVVDSVGPEHWKYRIWIDPLKMRDTLSRITEIEAISNAENRPSSTVTSSPYTGSWTLSSSTTSEKWSNVVSGTNSVVFSLRGDFKNGPIYIRVTGSLDSSGVYPFSRTLGPIAGPVN